MLRSALSFLGISLLSASVAFSSGNASAYDGEMWLAVSWQPAFCETKPDKSECQEGRSPSDFDATHFTLHGLWPDGAQFCGGDDDQESNAYGKNWLAIPKLTLDGNVKEELSKVMPGTESGLERYEWVKHGTCYGKNENEYFKDALSLIRELNNSAVQKLFESRIGKKVTRDEINAAFDESFGENASKRVSVICGKDKDSKRSIITEVRIALAGSKDEAAVNLKEMIAAAPEYNKNKGCKEGIVDPAEFQ